MLKKLNDFLASLPMTIVAGVFLLLDLVPHLMEEFGGAQVHTSFLPFDPAWVTIIISGIPLLYLAVWLVAAYLSGVAPGFTGFPRWFEMACILTPLLFIGLCWAMVKFIYRDIPLEDDDAA